MDSIDSMDSFAQLGSCIRMVSCFLKHHIEGTSGGRILEWMICGGLAYRMQSFSSASRPLLVWMPYSALSQIPSSTFNLEYLPICYSEGRSVLLGNCIGAGYIYEITMFLGAWQGH